MPERGEHPNNTQQQQSTTSTVFDPGEHPVAPSIEKRGEQRKAVTATATAAHSSPYPISTITPLRANIWERYLTHNNTTYEHAAYVLAGIRNGFRIGYDGPRDVTTCHRRIMNHIDTNNGTAEQIAFINNEMQKEVGLHRRAGPFDTPPFPNLMICPIGVVVKKFTSKLRLVHDYSYPKKGAQQHTSVNYHIPDDMRDTLLSSFDEALELLLQARALGYDIYMTKIDIDSAYRLIPIHPFDYHLLGIFWLYKYYYELTAPFGLASACQLWESVATALQWILKKQLLIRFLLHYVDDYFLVSNTKVHADTQLAAILHLCKLLGVTISMKKLVYPCKRLSFLGIGIDIPSWTIFLETDRLTFLQNTFTTWSTKTHTTVRELQSLCGYLNFCCRVIRQGRTFLRRIINYHAFLQTKSSDPHSSFPICHSVRADIEWWRIHLLKFNGTMSITPTVFPHYQVGDELYIATDACVQGYGAIFGSHWLHGLFNDEQQLQSRMKDTTAVLLRDSMPYKEMLAIVIATQTWGHLFKHKNLTFCVDCEPVVFALKKGDSKRNNLMSLIRVFATLSIQFEFNFKIIHLAGTLNVFADALSRSQISQFHTLCQTHKPQALQFHPSPSTPLIPTYSLC